MCHVMEERVCDGMERMHHVIEERMHHVIEVAWVTEPPPLHDQWRGGVYMACILNETNLSTSAPVTYFTERVRGREGGCTFSQSMGQHLGGMDKHY